MNLYGNTYRNRRVLVTGHTGFKGSWLIAFLDRLGAEIVGFSLDPPTTPNHYSLLNIKHQSFIGDILNLTQLAEVIAVSKPDIVFHLAAQSLVRYSYDHPLETLNSNILGTANVLECCRNAPSVRAIVVVTSDKCYQNHESGERYQEGDCLGGKDIYSASKGAAEIISAAYRESFFTIRKKDAKLPAMLATVRAGNVIGGGDWAADRLLPDIARAVINNTDVILRNPSSVRPWQHVLDCLSGYLLIGQKLLTGSSEFATAWNFGPLEDMMFTVEETINGVQKEWPEVSYQVVAQERNPKPEAGILRLDCSRAQSQLGWQPVWNYQTAIRMTAQWYRNYLRENIMLTIQNIEQYLSDAKEFSAVWIK